MKLGDQCQLVNHNVSVLHTRRREVFAFVYNLPSELCEA